MTDKIDLSVIIPVYNEGDTCAEIIKQVQAINIVNEIIVVDDASTDRTIDILEAMDNIKLIIHEKNSGKGAAVRTGLARVEGNYVITQDADLEYDPADFQKLAEPILAGQAVVVYGSRWLDKPISWDIHYLVNQMITLFAGVFNGVFLTDMATCYKLIPTKLLKGLDLQANGFGIDAEITAKLTKNSTKITEVPIHYSKRGKSAGKKLRLQDGIIAAWTCFWYRFLEK
jgi:glycosyltransferase involved in cell wall biosynthesis